MIPQAAPRWITTAAPQRAKTNRLFVRMDTGKAMKNVMKAVIRTIAIQTAQSQNAETDT